MSTISEDKKINLFLFDITAKGKVSGVMTFLNNLYANLNQNPNINVNVIRFVQNSNALIFQQVHQNQFVIETDGRLTIWEEYDFVWKNIEPMFRDKKNIILDLNTINLIFLADFIRKKTGAKILNRLHCIPGQTLIDTNPDKFFELTFKNQLPILPSEKESYELADINVAVANTGAMLIKQVSGKNAVVINNGIRDNYNNNRTFDDKTEWTAIAVGRIDFADGKKTYAKGLPYTIDALDRVNRKRHKVKLIAVGDVVDENVKEKITKKYPNVEIEFKGTIPNDELMKLYQTADFGIISSLTEQCNMTAIEMMMMGLPIIVSDIGVVSEIFTPNSALFSKYKLEPNCYLIKPYSIAENVIELIGNKKLREDLSKNARNLYLSNFTESDMITKILAIYESLI